MISKSVRFSSRNFEQIRKRMKSFRSGDFLFLYQNDSRVKKSHIAVVVAKKIIKHAVGRNRLRRQMYELLRTKLIPQIQTINCICLYKGTKIHKNSTELEKEIKKFIKFCHGKK